jgi:hypothetical protein
MTLSSREYDKQRILEDRQERDRAKQVILHILKMAGVGLGKSKLFKAFWLAHLFYAKNYPGYLSGWKIIRLPHGPGIDKGDDLIFQLKKSGIITVGHEPKGPYLETICRLVKEDALTDLPEAADTAINTAVSVIMRHDTAMQISEWSHEFSRSWNVTPNGSELDIYSDLIPDDVYHERKLKLDELNEIYDDLFK